MSTLTVEQADTLKLTRELQTKERELKELQLRTKQIRLELLEKLTKNDWKEFDIPGHVKVTLVEYIKSTVGTKGISTLKGLLKQEDIERIVKTKEFVDKEGIREIGILLTEPQLLEVIEQSPVRYVKLTDREAK